MGADTAKEHDIQPEVAGVEHHAMKELGEATILPAANLVYDDVDAEPESIYEHGSH